MFNPFKRGAHRPALRPVPGTRPYQVEAGIEVIEGDEDSDWALWEDSVQQYDSVLPSDPFEKIGKRDG